MLPIACWSLLTITAWLGATYEVYQPEVTRAFVVDASESPLLYNHDSSVAWFRGRWFCLWNANTVAEEGKPGQLNYQSTSLDGRHWSPPVACFSSPEAATNPIPCPKGTQWQPNLLVVRDELWAIWSQNSGDDYHGAWLSRLSAPDGRWESTRLLFDGSPDPVIDGRPWRIFPTQNPIRLETGRILAPVTLSDDATTVLDAPDGVTGWWARPKRNSVLWTDDRGQTWHCSPGTQQPDRTWAQWEPTVWAGRSTSVAMVARNNDPRPPAQGGPAPAERLLYASSSNGGETWTPLEPVALPTAVSRMHVVGLAGQRTVMAHNDWSGSAFLEDRRNLALFFSRFLFPNFAPGLGFTGDEPYVAYPAIAVEPNRLVISYSQGRDLRSIKVAVVSPLPKPDQAYIFPRTNYPQPARPAIGAGAIRFSGGQELTTRQPLTLSEAGFTLVAEVSGASEGTILDSRPGSSPGGILCGVQRGRPYVFLNNDDRNLTAPLTLPLTGWHTLTVTVDRAAAEVRFRLGDEQATVPITAPLTAPFSGTTARLGTKRFETSMVRPLIGDLRRVVVYPEPVEPSPQYRAALSLDARDPGSLQAAVTPAGPSPHRVEYHPGRPDRLVLRDLGSASVEIPERLGGWRSENQFDFKFRPLNRARQTVLTFGDVNDPTRLIVDDLYLRVERGSLSKPLGEAPLGAWTSLRLRMWNTFVDLESNQLLASLEALPENSWLFFGEGYPPSTWPETGGAVEIDVKSVRASILTHATEADRRRWRREYGGNF